MISVVIPLYNKEKYVANTLFTVFNQTFQDFEIVIVNDGSTDKSVEEVEKFNDSRIRLIYQENAGVSEARNKGIAEAKYDLIAFLDADDEWKPKYLQTQYELFQKYPECSIFACNYELKNTKGYLKPAIIRKLLFPETDGILTNYFEVASYSHPPISSISIMVKKEAILSVGGFPVGIKAGEDLLTWARLAVQYKIAYNTISESIYCFDLNEFNSNFRLWDENDYVGNELIRLYHNHFNVPFLKRYVGIWFKTRASVLLRYASWKVVAVECVKAIKYNPTDFRNLIYLLVAVLPIKFRLKLFRFSSMA